MADHPQRGTVIREAFMADHPQRGTVINISGGDAGLVYWYTITRLSTPLASVSGSDMQ
jgi:hypothetical protein